MLFLWMGSEVSYFYVFAGLAHFSPDLRVYATSAAPPDTTHPSIKESTKGGGAKRRPPLWRRREAPPPLWMGVWGLGRQQTRQKQA